MSCKEAATFLKSYFGGTDADQQRDKKTSSTQQAYALSSDMVNIVIPYSLSFPEISKKFYSNLCKTILNRAATDCMSS